ncbi:MAG: DUF3667 domain-containing protein [Cyclobacteriaceae bacterium]
MGMQEQCINCETTLRGNYCHACGQRNISKRITIRTLVDDFTSKWLGWDNKFLRTIKALTLQPGLVANKYIGGNRVSFVGPLGYAFLTSAIMILSFNWLGVDYGELIRASQEAMSTATNGGEPIPEEVQELNKTLNKLMTDHVRTMLFIMIPFIVFTGYVLYRSGSYGKKYNMLELSVLHIYLAGHSVWFTILLFPVFRLIGFGYSWILTVTSMIYVIFGMYDFHSKKGFRAVIKALVTYLIGLFLFMIVLSIFTIIYIIFFTDFIQAAIEKANTR